MKLFKTIVLLLLAAACSKDDGEQPTSDSEPEEPSVVIKLIRPVHGAEIDLKTATVADLDFAWTVEPEGASLVALLGQQKNLAGAIPFEVGTVTTLSEALPSLPAGMDIVDGINLYLLGFGAKAGEAIPLYWTVIPANTDLVDYPDADIRMLRVTLKLLTP
jgi:hypothetical protein